MVLKLSEELRRSLDAFFENDLNISQTAQSLFIHRNTMIYRLERIAEITGKNPQTFRDAWELQCGLWLICAIL
jgi:carbohydrate diacid regulator